jgi:murein DD-endopeptidase MepM/ murein hydrolase activator NlpD
MYLPITAGRYTRNWRTYGHDASFGANRKPGRLHAGCDLGAVHGTPVVAIEGGTVIERGKEPFIPDTRLWAIAIKHDTGFIGRYTEINEIPANLKVGSRVAAGQQLGIVQQEGRLSMLHFELYTGAGKGSLSMGKRHLRGKSAAALTDGDKQAIAAKGYVAELQRRDDILDPRDFLLALEANSISGIMAALKGPTGLPVITNQSRSYDGPMSVEFGGMAGANFSVADTQMAVDY